MTPAPPPTPPGDDDRLAQAIRGWGEDVDARAAQEGLVARLFAAIIIAFVNHIVAGLLALLEDYRAGRLPQLPAPMPCPTSPASRDSARAPLLPACRAGNSLSAGRRCVAIDDLPPLGPKAAAGGEPATPAQSPVFPGASCVDPLAPRPTARVPATVIPLHPTRLARPSFTIAPYAFPKPIGCESKTFSTRPTVAYSHAQNVPLSKHSERRAFAGG